MTSDSTQDAAAGDLRALAEATPDVPSTWIKLASALEESGAVAEAKEAWRTAWLLVPNSPRITEVAERLGIDLERVGAETERFGAETGIPANAGSPPSKPASTSTSQEEADPKSDPAELDIDTLISDLQSGRSKTTVEFEEPERDAANDPQSEGLVSETLAKIYESQNHLAEAAEIYEILAGRADDTERADLLGARAADLRKRSSSRS